jgi:hypothetical protein
MRRLGLIAVFVAATCGAASGEPASDRFAFIAWNPGAALSLVPSGFVLRSVLPVVLFNLEAGAVFAGGIYMDHQAIEARAVVGNSNATYLVVQLQVSGNWFFAEAAGWLSKGPNAGVSLRAWDLIQIASGVQPYNLAPMLDLGWWFDFGRWFIDVCLSQVFLVASLSSLPGSRPGVEMIFSPLPGISPWMPIGLAQIGLTL